MLRSRSTAFACAALMLATTPPASLAQQPRVSVSWNATPIQDVLRAFATFSGKSIVAGAGVTGSVTAEIVDQPWDVALAAVLAGRGLRAVEDAYGIIRVQQLTSANEREASGPRETRAYRLSYTPATEVQSVVAAILSPRGAVAVLQSTNTLVVTDVPRVHAALARLLERPGRRGGG